MKDTTVSFKLDRSLKARLVALAKSENRSLSNFIENVLRKLLGMSRSRRAASLVDKSGMSQGRTQSDSKGTSAILRGTWGFFAGKYRTRVTTTSSDTTFIL
ncbi:MAG: ribbon-helix-helix protein, CopG family [Candidatus Sulfotelmatobacter sp.]